MAWNQLVGANYGVQDYAGYCLRFTQSVYGAPVKYPTAWDAWLAVDGKHQDRNMPNTDVPIWFESWGTYNGVTKNWGHASVYQASTGRVFSSPGSGYGNKWFASISDAERQWGMRYVGWSEYLNGMQITNYTGDPAPAPAPSGQTHTVVPGDTLWGIAQTYYGDGTRYMEIFNASNFRSGNPNLIFPGEIAVIP